MNGLKQSVKNEVNGILFRLHTNIVLESISRDSQNLRSLAAFAFLSYVQTFVFAGAHLNCDCVDVRIAIERRQERHVKIVWNGEGEGEDHDVTILWNLNINT